EPPTVLDQRGNPRRYFVRRGLQRGSGITKLRVAIDEPLPRRFNRQRLDAANAGRNRALGNDLEQLDIAERPDMRATAKLDGIIVRAGTAHREDADFVAVF